MDREYIFQGNKRSFGLDNTVDSPIRVIRERGEKDEYMKISSETLERPADGRFELLDDEIANNEDDLDDVAVGSKTDGDSGGGGSGGIGWGRVGKVAIAVCALVAIGIVPTMRLVASESAQAIVNARVFTIRAPIAGEIWWSAGFNIGTYVNQSEIMGVVNNTRADASGLNVSMRELHRLVAERDMLSSKITTAKKERISLLAADRIHRAARFKQFQSRKQRVIAQISVAKANEANAVQSLERTTWLADRGLSTRALLDNKRRDSEVATRSVQVLQYELREIEIELDAAFKGIRLTDDHNTLSQTKVRANNLAFEIDDLKLQLGIKNRLISEVEDGLAHEQERFSEKQRMTVASPTGGRIWELLSSSGELVERGQPLFRLLDCRGALVSTSVSEAIYNQLKLGGEATFRSSGDLTEHRGEIVTMHGLAAPTANLAIGLANLHNEPFRVGVHVPDLVTEGKCTVGQTGIVRFDAEGGYGLVKRVRHWLDYWIKLS